MLDAYLPDIVKLSQVFDMKSERTGSQQIELLNQIIDEASKESYCGIFALVVALASFGEIRQNRLRGCWDKGCD